MNRLQQRIVILTCVILAFILFYVAYEEFSWNPTAIVGLLLGICLLYSLGRFIRDLKRRDIIAPRLDWVVDYFLKLESLPLANL